MLYLGLPAKYQYCLTSIQNDEMATYTDMIEKARKIELEIKPEWTVVSTLMPTTSTTTHTYQGRFGRLHNVVLRHLKGNSVPAKAMTLDEGEPHECLDSCNESHGPETVESALGFLNEYIAKQVEV